MDRIIQVGLQCLRDGDLDGAAKNFRLSLANAPGHAKASYFLGVTLARKGNLSEALPYLEAAVAAQQTNKDCYLALGVAQRRLGLAGDAEKTFRAVLKVDSNNFVGLCNLGELLSNRDEYLEALAVLNRAIELKPHEVAALNPLAFAMTRAGKAAAALSLLEDQSETVCNSAPLLYTRANALASVGQIDFSEEAAQAAVELAPEMAMAQWHIGLCRYDFGDYSGAISEFRKALATEPDFDLARGSLGISLLESGAVEEGLSVLRATNVPSISLHSLLDCWHSLIAPSRRDSLAKPQSFGFKSSHIRHALNAIVNDGLVIELGVYMGGSLSQIAEHVGPSKIVHGFDSFEGLPDDWIDGVDKGSYSSGGVLPDVPINTKLHVGWFEDKLPDFVDAHADKLAFANIDCDTYSSTKIFFDSFASKIEAGTILMFDEYFCYSKWRNHEYKAFQEFVAERDLSYEYIALSPITRQATVRIL